MKKHINFELILLVLLSILWGSSYLFIDIAVKEIPPFTLISLRVVGASLFLGVVMIFQQQQFPKSIPIWGMLFVQSLLTSTGAWSLLAWGQQYVNVGVASVLNSTAPLFVFLFTFAVTRHESTSARRFFGALIGITGVVLIIGIESLRGIGDQAMGQLACLSGAILYAISAIFSTRFSRIGVSSIVVATTTLVISSVIMVPIAIFFEQPFSLAPSDKAIVSAAILSLFCSGLAMLIYFRLIRTIGSLATASQAFLRSCVGVLLGIIILGEQLTVSISLGLGASILGVALINWPAKSKPN